MKYTVVMDYIGNGYSAYVPDLPGCVAGADTREETEELIWEAIVYHLAMLSEVGPVPEPVTTAPPTRSPTSSTATTTSCRRTSSTR